MHIVMINLAFKTDIDDKHVWVTVPPQNYGGVQWVIKNIADGLLVLGHTVTILGAPGSPIDHPNLFAPNVAEDKDVLNWLIENRGHYDIIHDHMCRGPEFEPMIDWQNMPVVHTHHISSPPGEVENVIAISEANAIDIGLPKAPVVRNPVNPAHYRYSETKDNYLLYLGRISIWKGADLAADFASKAGLKLVMAGPAFSKEDKKLLSDIQAKHAKNIEYRGNVGGEERKDLLSKAKAILVFSNGKVMGTSGRPWVEPGALVVSEAAVSGTPTISSTNGCLKEITPHVGICIDDVSTVSNAEVAKILLQLPESFVLRRKAIQEWGHVKIAQEYLDLYQKYLTMGKLY